MSYDENSDKKTNLLENIRQELATGSLAIDITDWLRNQFVTARNNEKLHAELLRTSGFFDLFPVLKNWDELTLNTLSKSLIRRAMMDIINNCELHLG
jgi:hypothetical protein